jgi:hypothetical protein
MAPAVIASEAKQSRCHRHEIAAAQAQFAWFPVGLIWFIHSITAGLVRA